MKEHDMSKQMSISCTIRRISAEECKRLNEERSGKKESQDEQEQRNG